MAEAAPDHVVILVSRRMQLEIGALDLPRPAFAIPLRDDSPKFLVHPDSNAPYATTRYLAFPAFIPKNEEHERHVVERRDSVRLARSSARPTGRCAAVDARRVYRAPSVGSVLV